MKTLKYEEVYRQEYATWLRRGLASSVFWSRSTTSSGCTQRWATAAVEFEQALSLRPRGGAGMNDSHSAPGAGKAAGQSTAQVVLGIPVTAGNCGLRADNGGDFARGRP